MGGNYDRSKTAVREHPGQAAESPNVSGRRTSRATQRARHGLRQQAKMFENLGIKLVHEEPDMVVLVKDHLSFRLEYEVDRKILARIYHLHVNTEIPSYNQQHKSHYRLDLKTRGVVNVSHEMAATGSGAREGQRIADVLSASGLVEGLVEKLDVEVLSIMWTPEKNAWEVSLGTYPGSHAQMFFPPLAYTIRLKEAEVQIVYEFLDALSKVLRET